VSPRPLRFHNTLTGKEELFEPLTPGEVSLYVCGVTPYDDCHLGHARCYVVFDFVRRALERLGYRVRHVQNFTDIDDKIIKRAAERGEQPADLAERHIADYFDKMDRLNVRRADLYPRVTGHIPQIVSFIERLVKKKLAYPLAGDVYYAVRKFPAYGRLSKRLPDDLLSGARVDVDARKEDPLDFALWKAAKPGEPAWDSPWGVGRPGWHIECSVMSLENLKAETLDIHGGGQDLIFPHHENEIAQSEGATGKPFARAWIHNGFVTVNKEKMSKSLGNFFTLADIFKVRTPRVVRFYLLSHHYRGPLEFDDDLLAAAADTLAEIDDDLRRLDAALKTPLAAKPKGGKALDAALAAFPLAVDEALADNFNSPRVLAVFFDLLGVLKSRLETPKSLSTEALSRGTALLRDVLQNVLGVDVGGPAKAAPADEGIQALVDRRAGARKAKDWPEADRLRRELTGRGVVVEDTPQGPRWWKNP